jgi:hypothetical protein
MDNNPWYSRTRASVGVNLTPPFELKVADTLGGVRVDIKDTPEVWFTANDLERVEAFAICLVNAVWAERKRRRLAQSESLDFNAPPVRPDSTEWEKADR